MSSRRTLRNSPELTLNLFDTDYSSANTSEAYTPSRREILIVPKPAIVVPQPQEHPARVLEERWFQIEALKEIAARMPIGAKRRGGKGELLKSPTGCGKTSIASRAIKSWLAAGERVLILTDLERLLDQMRDDLGEEGIFPLIEKAEHSALMDFGTHNNCVLASMQTLHTNRLQKWSATAFDKVVIDECHELKYTNIINHFRVPYLGLTATPSREDGKSLKEFYHYPYISTLTMRQAIEGWNAITQKYEKPFLSRIEILPIDAQHIDLSGIKLVGKDFDKRELDKKIWENTNWMASAIIEATEGRRTWIYCPRTMTADALAEAMRDCGASAASFHSKTPNPKEIFKRFETRQLQYLTNVGMLIKGVNVPEVDCIVRVCPTLNVTQATQQIGRGTRLSPKTGKKECLVVEFDFKADGKNLVGALDAILDGADDPDVKLTKAEKTYRGRIRDRALQLVKTKTELDAIRALDKAKEQLTLEDLEANKKKSESKRAKYEKVKVGVDFSQKYDPTAGLTKAGSSTSMARTAQGATLEQMQALEALSGGTIKVEHAKQWNTEAAAKRIRDLEIRVKYNYASEKQLKLMINTLGFDAVKAQKLRKWEARIEIDNAIAGMVYDLETSGKYDYDGAKALPVWKLASEHKRYCASAAK